ncbi:MAG: methyltransferase domain-containing protein [Pseudomonadota bacterium]
MNEAIGIAGGAGSADGAALGWGGRLGARWAAHAEAMEAQLAPLSDIALKVLATRPGERVMDLGAGQACTTLALADAVGPAGAVTALELSPDLAAMARARLADRPWAAVLEGDAATQTLSPASHDALFSRLGCMFFADPVPAFANLRAGLVPGGRVVLCAYTAREDNPWAGIPIEVAETVFGPKAAWPTGAEIGGPFAWAEDATVRAILTGAGFGDVAITPHDVSMPIGRGIAEDPVEAAITLTATVGPVGRRIALEPEVDRPAAVAAYAEAMRPRLAPFVRDGAVHLGGRFWLIEARA